MLMDHVPRCPYSWYVIGLHARLDNALEEFMARVEAVKGLDLRLELLRVRDRHGDSVVVLCGST
jgi:hypothetical protein